MPESANKAVQLSDSGFIGLLWRPVESVAWRRGRGGGGGGLKGQGAAECDLGGEKRSGDNGLPAVGQGAISWVKAGFCGVN